MGQKIMQRLTFNSLLGFNGEPCPRTFRNGLCSPALIVFALSDAGTGAGTYRA